jgi:hypothetical protein
MKIAFRAAASFLVVVSLKAAGQAWNDIGCLSTEQQQAYLAMAQKLASDFNLDGLKSRWAETGEAKRAAEPEARACAAKPQPFAAIAALTDGCPGKIAAYNARVAASNSAEEDLRVAQEAVLRQLTLQRATFRACSR